jgi:RNA polymerase sigma-70 factor (ECF subfamily)
VPRAVTIEAPPPANDGPTVAAIFRTHAAQVGRWAARLGGPRIDAEEVVQEVFEIVSRKLRGFRGDAKLDTWLFGITDNVVRNLRRRQVVRRILVGWSDDLAERASEAPSPFEDLEAKRRAARAYAVLDRLPERDRRVMILFELEQLPSEEIAVLLGTKASTVRVWLHRARERFLACQQAVEKEEERR